MFPNACNAAFEALYVDPKAKGKTPATLPAENTLGQRKVVVMTVHAYVDNATVSTGDEEVDKFLHHRNYREQVDIEHGLDFVDVHVEGRDGITLEKTNEPLTREIREIHVLEPLKIYVSCRLSR